MLFLYLEGFLLLLLFLLVFCFDVFFSMNDELPCLLSLLFFVRRAPGDILLILFSGPKDLESPLILQFLDIWISGFQSHMVDVILFLVYEVPCLCFWFLPLSAS